MVGLWEEVGDPRHAYTARLSSEERRLRLGQDDLDEAVAEEADTMPTFTVVCFSDMMLIEFTRTYEGWMASV